MALWVAKVNIKDEWQKARAGEISVHELVRILAPKFRGLVRTDGELEDLIDEMEALDSESTLDDFDDVWDRIYDWADSNHVWIATF